MDFFSIITVIILVWLLHEAIRGKQKKFARIGIGVLFINMVLFNIGAYGELFARSVAYVGLAVLAAMLAVRIWHHIRLPWR